MVRIEWNSKGMLGNLSPTKRTHKNLRIFVIGNMPYQPKETSKIKLPNHSSVTNYATKTGLSHVDSSSS